VVYADREAGHKCSTHVEPRKAGPMLLPKFYVDSPTPSPRKFGLFSVAQPTNLNNGKWLGGVEYPSDNCAGDVSFAADPCNPAAKDYSDEPDFFEAYTFYVYTLRGCRAPGAINDAKDRAVKTFTGAEERGAEAGLWASLVADTNAVNLGATALCPEAAVAVLEDWLGKNYGGTGVIHAPRDAARSSPPTLASVVTETCWRPNSALASPLALATGTPVPAQPLAPTRHGCTPLARSPFAALRLRCAGRS
jgi:hypothetical protein